MVHIFTSFSASLQWVGRRLVLIYLLTATVAHSVTAQDTTQVGYAPAVQVPVVPDNVAPAPTPAPASAPDPIPASSAAPVVSFRQPAFPGGAAALARFLKQNLQFPAVAAEAHVSGRVVVSFWVDEAGRAYGFGAVQSPHPALEAEALRVARKITYWEPGLQEGRPAPMQMYLPVVFKLVTQ